MVQIGQKIYYIEANTLTCEIFLQEASICQVFEAKEEKEQRFLISTHPYRSCSFSELNMVFSKDEVVYAWGPDLEQVKKAVSDNILHYITRLETMRYKVFAISKN